jgi:hypothetical protein
LSGTVSLGSATLASGFTVLPGAPPAPPPTITSLTPNSGYPSTTVTATVTGTNFISGTVFSMPFITVTVLSMTTTQANLSLAISPNVPPGTGLSIMAQSVAGFGTLGPVPSVFTILSGTPPPPGDGDVPLPGWALLLLVMGLLATLRCTASR